MSEYFRKKSPAVYFNDGHWSMSVVAFKGKKPEDVPNLIRAINAARKAFEKAYKYGEKP